MKNIKKIVAKLSAFVPALALIMGIITVNSACVTLYHQPETPDAMNEYRR